MPSRKREIALSLERPLGPGGPSGTLARLTALFEVGPNGEGPAPSELKKTLEDLSTELDALVGPSLAATPLVRPDRTLTELVETYRPRQRELIDLLRDEGEISTAEHAMLDAYLADRPARAAPEAVAARTSEPLPDRSIAAVPIAADRGAAEARPVPELLRVFQISSLRQAGAVRARRQISFAEYMALKRHFEAADAGSGRPAIG